MELNTNQFKLESLRSTPARPTIPYSQFPRPTLQDPEASFENRRRSNTDDEGSYASSWSRDSSRTRSEDEMESGASSRNRRQSNRDPNARNTAQQPQARNLRNDPQHERRWSEDDEPWEPNGSKSDSDQGHHSEFTDDGQDDEETGLTGGAKNKQRRRRKHNTRLDHRIVGEDDITQDEKKEADKNVLKDMVINGLFILLWYIFSLSISIYNKWMFSSEHLDFNFPLFTTSLHMLVQFSLASLVLWLLPQFRPRADALSHPSDVYTQEEQRQHDLDADEHKPLMTKLFYLTRLGPCGIATGLDIGLGNMSLRFITLTFYTMCKSSSLAFVLLFAFLFHLEQPSAKLIIIIATMTVGVMMMVSGEVDFSPIGFFLVISAAFFSGFRWALTQILLLRNPATSNPFASIFFLAPVMFVTLIVIAIPVEGPYALYKGLGALIDSKGALLGPLILLTPGAIAFCMTASEFALLQRTSVVTLSIAGIFKEVVTIVTAGRVFEDTMTPINLAGLVVTIGAIAGYNYFKVKKMRHEAQIQTHLAHMGVEPSQQERVERAEESEDESAHAAKGKGSESRGLLGSRGNSPRSSSPR